VKTTVAVSCQSEIFKVSRKLRKNSVKRRACECCSKEYTPSHRAQISCSLSCGQKINQDRRHGTSHRKKCATCHALIGMAGAMSGRLLGMDKSSICIFRKKNGLKTLSASAATKSAYITSGRHAVKDGKRLANTSGEQWWKDEWADVVDNYWTGNNAMRWTLGANMRCSESMVKYWLNVDARREQARFSARRSYRPDGVQSIRRKLRNHISRVHRKTKTGKTRKLIECLGGTVTFVKRHLERQFKDGMTWRNHGALWEIDHIIPMSMFNLHDPNERMRVNHFTNLRPMMKSGNRQKGSRMDVIAHQPILF